MSDILKRRINARSANQKKPISRQQNIVIVGCGLGCGELNPQATALPQRVVQARYSRHGVIVALHVHERELFEYVALDYYEKIS